MNRIPKLKMLFYLLVVTTLLSCNNEDGEMNPTNELIGTWQRSDASAVFEYELVFLPDNSGYRTILEKDLSDSENPKAISTAKTFDWHVTFNQLTLTLDEELKTPYTFNAEGQLVLSELHDLPFNKLE